MRPFRISVPKRFTGMAATVEIDDDPGTVLLQHDIGGRNVVVNQAERVEVSGSARYSVQLSHHSVLNERPSAEDERSLVQVSRIHPFRQCRAVASEAKT